MTTTYFKLRYTYRKLLGIFRLSLETFSAEGLVSYIKDSGGFIKKTRNLGSIHEDSILVTANIVGLHPSIPNKAGLSAFKEVRNNREQQAIPTSKLIRMADFFLKSNYFEFNGQVKQHIFGTTFIVYYLLLVPSLLNPTRFFLWMKLKLLFMKPKDYNFRCDLDTLTIFFLSGQMVSINFKIFCVVLMRFMLILNLHTSMEALKRRRKNSEK